MNDKKAFRTLNLTIREYSFFLLSLLAGCLFFLAYPSQDPRTVVDLSLDAETIEQKAISHFERLGYSATQFWIETDFRANEYLLDSLQAEMGRPRMIDFFKKNDVPNIKPFYWEISFKQKEVDDEDIIINSDNGSSASYPANTILMRFDAEGNLLELRNPYNILPHNLLSRQVLAAVFPAQTDSALAVLSEFNDSTLTELLFLNIAGTQEAPRKDRLPRMEKLLRQGRHYILGVRDVFNMATHYLENTGWNVTELEADTVVMHLVDGQNSVSAHFKAKPYGQELALKVDITPTGGLLGLEAKYNQNGSDELRFSELWELIRISAIFLFCLAGVVIFFFRIRARAIDTKPAIIVAIIAGLAIFVQVVLVQLSDVFSGPMDGTRVAFGLIGAGVAGAATCLLAFVFFAIGDSITRQHWAQKLNTYDYLRQGMLFNQPIGSVMVRSVLLSFVLAGAWTVLLAILPGLYIEVQNVFLHSKSLWPPLSLLISTLTTSLTVVLSVFLVLGGLAYAKTKNRLIVSAVMIFACTFIVPITGSYGPVLDELLITAAMGGLLVLIYLKWDFLTLLISHFLFLCLLETTSGWIIEGSTDTYIFISFLLLMAFLTVSGLMANLRGKKETKLTRFVPEYVEELAQEERIKQELQIARDVQQSFLPVKTPQFPNLELSAVCRPAYETGGDYYDFIPLDENRIAVTIGDVSGKGIQAAFYMTFVKGIIHSLCREISSPSELLKKANRLFCENARRGTFISLVYGIIDLEEHTFHFARAGHNPILRINSQNDIVEELQPKGIGIGLTKDDVFDNNIEEIKLNLTTDDVLILYTDGIVEALNERHKFYGTKRLNELLKKHKRMSAKSILEELTQDVYSYIGEAKQHDDMTMMVMKLKD